MNAVLNKTRNPLDIAAKLDIPITKAREMVRACKEPLEGWGPLRKQPNIIARRHVNQGWHGDLSHFRKLHDQGKVNLCQGRDGNYILLYAQWNNPAIQRRAYFYTDRGY